MDRKELKTERNVKWPCSLAVNLAEHNICSIVKFAVAISFLLKIGSYSTFKETLQIIRQKLKKIPVWIFFGAVERALV